MDDYGHQRIRLPEPCRLAGQYLEQHKARPCGSRFRISSKEYIGRLKAAVTEPIKGDPKSRFRKLPAYLAVYGRRLFSLVASTNVGFVDHAVLLLVHRKNSWHEVESETRRTNACAGNLCGPFRYRDCETLIFTREPLKRVPQRPVAPIPQLRLTQRLTGNSPQGLTGHILR